jgi:hypothetical protein
MHSSPRETIFPPQEGGSSYTGEKVGKSLGEVGCPKEKIVPQGRQVALGRGRLLEANIHASARGCVGGLLLR